MADHNITRKLLLRQTGRGNLKRSYFQNHCSALNVTNFLTIGSVFHKDEVMTIDVDEYGRYLLIGTQRGCLAMINTLRYDSNLHLRRTHFGFCPHLAGSAVLSNCIASLKWLPDHPDIFLSGGTDMRITVWNAESFQQMENFNLQKRVSQISVSEAKGFVECLVAVASLEECIKLIDLRTGQFTHELRGLPGGSVSCSWSPSKDYLIAAGGFESKVRLWDIRSSSSCLAELNVRNNAAKSAHALVNGVIFTPRGRHLLTSCNSTISCWDAEYFQNVYFKPGQVSDTKNKSIHFQVGACGGFEVAFVPSNNSVVVINLQTGETVTTLLGHYSTCNCVDINRRTLNVYSGGVDTNIILWSSISQSVNN